MTEIFDPQKARRLAVLRQASAPNVIKINPDTATFLRRYENADVSRLKLLEAQRLRQESEAERELIKLQEQRLKKRLKGKGKSLPKGRGPGGRSRKPKRFAKGKKGRRRRGGDGEGGGPGGGGPGGGGPGGGGPGGRGPGGGGPGDDDDDRRRKTPLEVEIDVQERRDKLRREQALIEQGDRRLQLEDFRQQREFVSAERDRQQRELQRQTGFISGQNRIAADQQIANYNAAQAALRTQATNDSRTAQAIANRRQQEVLQGASLELQARELDANFETNRQERAVRYAEIDNDRARYDRDVRRAAEQREVDLARLEAERADIRERVARDDAFRHRQLEETQRLALENLAQQQRDNTARRQLEQNRIDNQRAVDAERAITDRELIQGFTSAIQTLGLQRESDPPRSGPSAEELAATVREGLKSGVGAKFEEPPRSRPGTEGLDPDDPGRFREPEPQQQPQPEPALTEVTTTTTTGSTPELQRSPLTGIEQTGSEIAAEAQRAAVQGGIRGGAGTATTDPDLGTEAEEVIQIQESPQDPTPRATVAQRRAARSPRRTPSPRRGPSPRRTLTLEEHSGSSVASSEEGLDPATQRSLSIMSGRPSPQQQQRGLEFDRFFAERPGQTPPPAQGTPAGRPGGGQIETVAEDSTLQQVGGAIGEAVTGAVTGLARGAGGIVGGVAQGIGEQLPAASDVGAAVGRAGVRAVAGVGGAIYEGIAGGEPEDQPLERGE